jgi:hypothetical protein
VLAWTIKGDTLVAYPLLLNPPIPPFPTATMRDPAFMTCDSTNDLVIASRRPEQRELAVRLGELHAPIFRSIAGLPSDRPMLLFFAQTRYHDPLAAALGEETFRQNVRDVSRCRGVAGIKTVRQFVRDPAAVTQAEVDDLADHLLRKHFVPREPERRSRSPSPLLLSSPSPPPEPPRLLAVSTENGEEYEPAGESQFPLLLDDSDSSTTDDEFGADDSALLAVCTRCLDAGLSCDGVCVPCCGTCREACGGDVLRGRFLCLGYAAAPDFPIDHAHGMPVVDQGRPCARCLSDGVRCNGLLPCRRCCRAADDDFTVATQRCGVLPWMRKEESRAG